MVLLGPVTVNVPWAVLLMAVVDLSGMLDEWTVLVTPFLLCLQAIVLWVQAWTVGLSGLKLRFPLLLFSSIMTPRLVLLSFPRLVVAVLILAFPELLTKLIFDVARINRAWRGLFLQRVSIRSVPFLVVLVVWVSVRSASVPTVPRMLWTPSVFVGTRHRSCMLLLVVLVAVSYPMLLCLVTFYLFGVPGVLSLKALAPLFGSVSLVESGLLWPSIVSALGPRTWCPVPRQVLKPLR